MISFKLIAFFVTISLGVARGKDPNKIINGEDTFEGEFPSQVIIFFRGQYKCTGTIIDELHIITAGHCVFHGNRRQPPDEFTIQSGITDKSPWLALIYDVVKIHLHNNYTLNETHANDIAIMTIDKNIKFNKVRQPAKLPELEETPEGTSVMVSGLGKVKNSRGYADFPNEVKKLKTSIISNLQCETMLRRTILPQQLCTYKPGGFGVCDGDSGGGLLYGDILIGIVSFAIPCAINDRPDVYTRVHEYVSWINEKLASEE